MRSYRTEKASQLRLYTVCGGPHRVRYGADGAPKTRAHGPFPHPAPLNGLGRGVSFRISCPWHRSRLRRTHTQHRSPLKIGGNKQGPVQGMSAG